MEMIERNMCSLFAQLGEPNAEVDIARFISAHGDLPGDTPLHEAHFWSVSQAGFLREAIMLDGAWALVVDELNAKLHRTPATGIP
jgi:hypothetical protein